MTTPTGEYMMREPIELVIHPALEHVATDAGSRTIGPSLYEPREKPKTVVPAAVDLGD